METIVLSLLLVASIAALVHRLMHPPPVEAPDFPACLACGSRMWEERSKRVGKLAPTSLYPDRLMVRVTCGFCGTNARLILDGYGKKLNWRYA